MQSNRLNEQGYLTPEFAERAAIKDFYCPGCRAPLTVSQGRLLIMSREVTCGCGEEYDTFSVLVVLSPDNPS